MASKIALAEYARQHGKSPANARQLAGRGSFRTAEKIGGRDWVIDPTEPWPDHRKGRKLRPADVFAAEAYESLTAEERLAMLKWEQAKEYSGLRPYGSICERLYKRLPEDALERYTAAQLGEILQMLYRAYEDGKAEGR
ncbi:MAG: hypothetical protein LUC48_07470 [Clostridiales bacterium]|nr:hypothetical protein [Clostridiales bacterium]